MPLDPDVFGQPTRSEVVERGANHLRDVLHLPPLDARHGIEIDAQFVGMIELLGADRMRMQLDAGQVGHPCERGRVAGHDLFSGAARRELQRDDFDPLRTRIRRALLVEELLAETVRISHQHVRPAARAAQRALGNLEVVRHEIELRVTGLWEQHLAGICDRHLTPGNVEDRGFSLLRHVCAICAFCGPGVLRDRRPRLRAMRSGAEILRGPGDLLPELTRCSQRKIRVAQQFARDQDRVGLAGPDNVLRLSRGGDHADSAGQDPGVPANALGKRRLIAGADRNLRGRDVAARRAVDQIDAERLQLPRELDRLFDVPAAARPNRSTKCA